MRCSQCALVSSSGHLVNTSAGAEIDSYPCVLRMNSAPVRGYENDVGRRTTIRIMGHVNLKVLNASNELQDELLINSTTRAEKVSWLYRASFLHFNTSVIPISEVILGNTVRSFFQIKGKTKKRGKRRRRRVRTRMKIRRG